MGCGCGGSQQQQQQGQQATAQQAAAAPQGPRGTRSPGYYWTGPQKRAEQAEKQQR